MQVLKIGAIWCNACNVMRPRWKKIESELPDLQTTYYEYDDSPDVIEKYHISTEKLPVFIFLDKSGSELVRLVGEVSEKEILENINKYTDQ